MALWGCAGKGQETGANAPPPEVKALPVRVTAVKTEALEQRIEITGTLAAAEEATVAIEADGRVVAVGADLGDKVSRGKVLARIADQEYGFKKVQTEADLAAAESDFGRVQNLLKGNVATRAQLDESRRRLDVARTAASLANKKLADTSLRAPFNGYVARRMINLGEYVRTGTAAFNVVRISPLKFRGDVPERYTMMVKVGAPVEATSESYPGQVLAGKVVRISPIVSVDTRSFQVEAEIENPKEEIKPGAFATLAILAGTLQSALTIPETALAEFAGNFKVYVVKNGAALERPVDIFGRQGKRIIVARGLTAGEVIVASGVDQLTDGLKVVAQKE